MPRDKTIKILRTSRANLDTQKNANGLLQGEPYLITDENRLAIGTEVNDYVDFAKKSEVDAKKTDNVSTNSKILGRKTSGSGAIEELTVSEVLDFIGSAAEGDILYRGASAWARLPKGTDGQVLTLSNGLPSWAAAGGGGSATKYVLRTSDFVNTSTSFVDVTGMSFSVEANKKYYLQIALNHYNADYEMNDGLPSYIKLVLPGGTFHCAVIYTTTGNTVFMSFNNYSNGDYISLASAASTQYESRRVFFGIFACTSNGTLKLQLAASHESGWGSKLLTRSYMTLTEVTS